MRGFGITDWSSLDWSFGQVSRLWLRGSKAQQAVRQPPETHYLLPLLPIYLSIYSYLILFGHLFLLIYYFSLIVCQFIHSCLLSSLVWPFICLSIHPILSLVSIFENNIKRRYPQIARIESFQ